ncbi:oligopeptidase F [Mycoplasma testudineum]|uniref:Oligopeptidase F n=1 Tax=Mycoplasma testudineum TaxID=244584 RepID=A0A4R6IFT2_9MOLU|nr:oligoendopeptidase F [Mycoplasma testudineum]TDO21210.1 oligopeptidase F [Mycoplasma testudineum]
MQYKKYEDVPEKYRFDLEAILEGSTIESLFEKITQGAEKLVEVKDEYLKDKDSFLKFLKAYDRWSKLVDKASNYISNNLAVNVIDPKYNQLNQKFMTIYYKFIAKFGDHEKRILDAESLLKEWLKDEAFKNYRKDLEFTLNSKKFRLPAKVEEYLKKRAYADINLSEIFSVISNSELDYGYAQTKEGKRKTKITLANHVSLLEDKDEDFRKSAYIGYNRGFAKHRQSFAKLLISHFRDISAAALLRGHKSSVESYLWEDQVDKVLVKNLYQKVASNTHILQKYWTNYAKFFKSKYNKTYKRWDSKLPLVKVQSKYSVEEAQELILAATKDLGQEYQDVLKKAFNENWIDYMPVDNKRSGAYSIGQSYPLEKKYINMNYDYKLTSVKTLAHELGHSMHSYFSDKKQAYNLSQYPIFLAEIASIFNELMLEDYLMHKTKDKKLQFNLLSDSIQDFQNTVFRQTHFSEYEYTLYKAMDQNVPLGTFEDLQKIYQDLGNKYKIDNFPEVVEKHEQAILSVMVPHYYYNFYVYKYAIGYVVANVFFKKYKDEGISALENYIDKFLSMGSKLWPADLLKESGIDLYSPEIYDLAFELLNQKVDKFISLGKEIFKK